MSEHRYAANLIWDGNTGEGTRDYGSYSRRYRVQVGGKPELAGTADPAFRGEADRHNPEDLFLAAIAACHMLFYLALCARRGVRVLAYQDRPSGTMATRADGGGAFAEILLRPRVLVAPESDPGLAVRLHDSAHELCFLANSCRFPIRHQATVETDRRSETCKT